MRLAIALVMTALLSESPDAAERGSPPSVRPYNVVLLAVDGLRADHLGLYGYRRATSPHLDSRAKAAVVFERAIAPASWTLPSFASMFSGLPPLEHRALSHRRQFPASKPLLAEALRTAGYRTAAFAGGHFLDPVFGLMRGFDLRRNTGWGRYDFLRTTAPRGARWIRDHHAQGPFFLFVHGNDVHPPFMQPESGEATSLAIDEGRRGGLVDSSLLDYSFVAAFNAGREAKVFFGFVPPNDYLQEVSAIKDDPAEMARVAAHYDSRILAADHDLETVFQALAETGREKDTLVVLLSDHGLELGERGALATAFHHSLADEIIRVPLVLWHPDLPARRVQATVALEDLPATILELAGLSGRLPGRSFAGLARGKSESEPREAFSVSSVLDFEGTIRLHSIDRGEWKLVYDQESEQTRLFNIKSDPGETLDVSAREPKITRSLLERLSRRVGRSLVD